MFEHISIATHLTIAEEHERALAADNDGNLKLEALAKDVIFRPNHVCELTAVSADELVGLERGQECREKMNIITRPPRPTACCAVESHSRDVRSNLTLHVRCGDQYGEMSIITPLGDVKRNAAQCDAHVPIHPIILCRQELLMLAASLFAKAVRLHVLPSFGCVLFGSPKGCSSSSRGDSPFHRI